MVKEVSPLDCSCVVTDPLPPAVSVMLLLGMVVSTHTGLGVKERL